MVLTLKKLLILPFLMGIAVAAAPVKTVHFPSEDGRTTLVGYLFEPEFEQKSAGPHPAVVLLHGRAGAYSSLAHGVYTAETLAKRHKEWGQFWAAHGYVALLVDSFLPRGYPAGFPPGSYKDRPAAVSEQTVRPLDAYGALRYLRTRRDIAADRIGVQGWSNGAMTVLVTMGHEAPGIVNPTPEKGFRVALAEYPGCGMDAIKGEYRPYARLLITVGTADKEVSPKVCESFASRAREGGADLEIIVFEGAQHNYDDPASKEQSNPANARATEETMRKAERLFREKLMR